MTELILVVSAMMRVLPKVGVWPMTLEEVTLERDFAKRHQPTHQLTNPLNLFDDWHWTQGKKHQ